MSRHRDSRFVPFQKPAMPEGDKKTPIKKKKKIDQLAKTALEETILKIAVKLTKKGPLNVQELYWLSMNQLKVNAYEISQAIYELIMKNYITKRTEITDDTVLLDETRQNIAVYISSFPGCTLKEILENTHLTPHHAAYHILMLEEFGYIKKSKIKNFMAYFASKIDPDYHESIFLLKNPTNFKVLEVILLNQQIDIIRLATRSQLNVRQVREIISSLKELKLINEGREGRETVYLANFKLVEPLLKILQIPQSKIEQFKIPSKEKSKKREKPKKEEKESDGLKFLKEKGRRRSSWT